MALLQEDIFRLSLSVVGRVAACIAVQLLCSQSDADRSLGPALDPRAAVRIAGMFCAALRCSAHPCPWLGSPTANPCTADISGAWWLGLFGLAVQARLAPLATRANFFSPICGG